MAQVGDINVRISADTSGLTAGVSTSKRELDSLGRSSKATSNTVSSSMASMGKAALGFAAAYATIGTAINIGTKILDTTAEFEKLNAMLITATGSVEGASVAFAKIKEFAVNTPYQLSEVTTSFIKLQNLGLNPSEKALMSYGNTASSMGKSLDQMIEAVADASVGEFERLKEFGIKSSKQGDDVSFTFRGMTETVASSSEAIQAHLIKLGESNFGNAMALQMETVNGKVSNMEDVWANAFNNIGSSNSGLIGDAIQGMTALGQAIADAFDSSVDAQIRTLEDSLFDMQARLTEIAQLKKGWFGEAIDATGASIEINTLNSAIDETQEKLNRLEQGKADTAEVAEKQSTSGGENKYAKDTEDFMQSLLDKAAGEQEFMEARHSATQAYRDMQAELEQGVTNKDLERSAAKLESLQESYLSESELLIAKYEEQQLIIDEAYLNEQLSKEEHEALMTDISKKGADARNALSKAEGDKKLKFTSDILGNVSSLMSSKNKEMFEIGKIAATANAVVNTYQGATKALAEVPYPFNFAAAASVVVAGMAQVSSIQSTSFSGASAAAPAVGAPAVSTGAVGATADTSAPSGGTLTVEGLSASSLFTGDAVAQLAEELLDYQSRGGNVVLQS